MRTTKASAAIERLNKRDPQTTYAMAMNSKGLFSLLQIIADQEHLRLCTPMLMDEFVAYVNAYGPQTPKRVSKLELAFSQQLQKK
jgi:hypothetical protein